MAPQNGARAFVSRPTAERWKWREGVRDTFISRRNQGAGLPVVVTILGNVIWKGGVIPGKGQLIVNNSKVFSW